MFQFALAAYGLLLPFPSAGIARGPELPPALKSGEELLSLMRDRYARKWYRTLTFTQKTTFPDGRIETWYEALELPGRLRIDIAPLDSGKTLLFRNDSLYVFDQKTLKTSQPLAHPLMVLGFDVYQAPAKEAAQKLQGLKFDLSKLHQTTWRGRSTYVVGAAPGDTTSPQFWIDARAAVLRPQPGALEEGPSSEVLFLANGKQQVKEEYSNPKANVRLDPGIFDPSAWKAPGWIGREGGQRP